MAAGHKRRPKRTRPSGKGGGPEPREEKRKRRELDGVGLAEESPPPGSSLGLLLDALSPVDCSNVSPLDYIGSRIFVVMMVRRRHSSDTK